MTRARIKYDVRTDKYEATETNATLVPEITEGSKQLFIELAEDAGNWSGSPLFGANVGGDDVSRGHLTHLKKLGLVTTYVDEDDPSGSRFRRDAWVIFTDLGVRYAEELGIDYLRDEIC